MKLFAPKLTVCTFCWTKTKYDDLLWRCLTNPFCPGRQTDPIYAAKRGITPVEMGLAFAAKGRHKVHCPRCNKWSFTRLCPVCHLEMPSNTFQRIISVIGASNSGKSHYITTLLYAIEHLNIGHTLGFSGRFLGDETNERWQRDFYKPLYQDKTVLIKTQTASTNTSVKIPLIYRLTFRSNSSGLPLSGGKPPLDLTFFDAAGEDSASTASMLHNQPQILNSDGIIFIIDPMQFQAVYDRLPADKRPKRNEQLAPKRLVTTLIETFEKGGQRGKIKVPVAITFSKVDALFDIIDRGSALRTNTEFIGSLDLDKVQSLSTEIETYLKLWEGTSFTDTISNHFTNVCYFGVSALGSTPQPNGSITSIASIRVEDPFLWLLYQFDLIPGKKGR